MPFFRWRGRSWASRRNHWISLSATVDTIPDNMWRFWGWVGRPLWPAPVDFEIWEFFDLRGPRAYPPMSCLKIWKLHPWWKVGWGQRLGARGALSGGFPILTAEWKGVRWIRWFCSNCKKQSGRWGGAKLGPVPFNAQYVSVLLRWNCMFWLVWVVWGYISEIFLCFCIVGAMSKCGKQAKNFLTTYVGWSWPNSVGNILVQTQLIEC